MKRLFFIGALLILGVSVFVVTLDMFQQHAGGAASDLGTASVTRDALLSTATIVPSPTPLKPVTLLFGGDMMFDRHIRQKADAQGGYGFLFDQIDELLGSQDLVIANLEGPVTDSDSRSVGSIPGEARNYSFTFDPAVVSTLSKTNIRLVNLGNNHILNFGPDGLVQTKQWLEQSGVGYFGHASASGQLADEFALVDLHGINILFANYNQFIETDVDALIAQIAQAQTSAEYTILYSHWGNEYQTESTAVIQALAHRFVDEAGVDLIIGSHPHVVQESEQYHGSTIYYSLGNFVFDQYFEPNVKRGLLVSVTLDPESLVPEFTEYPIDLRPSGQTVLATEG